MFIKFNKYSETRTKENGNRKRQNGDKMMEARETQSEIKNNVKPAGVNGY